MGSGPIIQGSSPCPPAKKGFHQQELFRCDYLSWSLKAECWQLIFMVPSSSGLGYRPLTAETRVRVPLGLPRKFKGLTYLVNSFFFNVINIGQYPKFSTQLPENYQSNLKSISLKFCILSPWNLIPSLLSIFIFSCMAAPALLPLNPPIRPDVATTLCQGTSGAYGFFFMAWPTPRYALLPKAWAISL